MWVHNKIQLHGKEYTNICIFCGGCGLVWSNFADSVSGDDGDRLCISMRRISRWMDGSLAHHRSPPPSLIEWMNERAMERPKINELNDTQKRLGNLANANFDSASVAMFSALGRCMLWLTDSTIGPSLPSTYTWVRFHCDEFNYEEWVQWKQNYSLVLCSWGRRADICIIIISILSVVLKQEFVVL